MRALLIYPPVGGREYTGIPLGVFYLAGAVGSGADVIDGRIEGEGPVVEAIKTQYDVVGISCLSNVRHLAFGVARAVRALSPRTRIVLGGHHVSSMPEDVRGYPFVDEIITGDGEGPFAGYVKTGIVGKPILDIDAIPFPAWDQVKFNLYPRRGRWKRDLATVNGVKIKDYPLVSILSSRGCVGSCTFCSWTTWHDYRTRDPRSVVEEMFMLQKKYGQRHFEFVDDCFGADKAKTMKMCELLADLKIAWRANVRPDGVDAEMVKMFKRSGCYALFMGVESGSRTILKTMHKKLDIDLAAANIRIIKAAGIYCSTGIVIGMPGETDETVGETVRFLRAARPDRIEVNAGTMILPGTALYHRAKREGLIDDSFWRTEEDYRVYVNGFTRSDLKRWARRVKSYRLTERLRLWRSALISKRSYRWQKS
jgi:radical SAM superfamily enzyme YgiQ (UPF0313 family)